MNRVVILAMLFLAVASTGRAKNHVYGTEGSSLESEGYKLFASDRIVDTVDRPKPADDTAAYCTGVTGTTTKNLGEADLLRNDSRLATGGRPLSYAAACTAYHDVTRRLTTADDARRLWLLFADSATDDYAVRTEKKEGAGEDARVLIEMRRLATVARYIEFFTRNKEWRLTDYTFLSQAAKSRKGKPLSPAFSRFVSALLTGDAETAYRAVRSVDLDNLGGRFTVK